MCDGWSLRKWQRVAILQRYMQIIIPISNSRVSARGQYDKGRIWWKVSALECFTEHQDSAFTLSLNKSLNIIKSITKSPVIKVPLFITEMDSS